MAAARQVVRVMKQERQVQEKLLQRRLLFNFPITVPYRDSKNTRHGRHDLGEILHAYLPRIIAFVWCVLSLVAVSAVIGGVEGALMSGVFFIIEVILYFSFVAKYIEKTISTIRDDYSDSIAITSRDDA